MRARAWEFVLSTFFLVFCLVGGLWLGQEYAPTPKIGVLRFEGVVDFASEQYIAEVLEAAAADQGVAGIVVEILSPGGFATSSESIFYSMLQFREQKPLVVHIDGLAASGGYFMAAAGNRIYAAASAYVGNIGARTIRPSDPSLSPAELSTGPYKLSGGSRFDQIHQLSLVGDTFVDSVVHQRENAAENPLAVSKETVAEARIYLGSEAAAIGLIDFEGSRSDAVAGAAELASVNGYETVDLPTYLGIAPPQLAPDFVSAVHEMVDGAPPETIYLLDSRMALNVHTERPDLDAHLLSLRGDGAGLYRRPADAMQDALPGFLRNALPQTRENR